MAINGTVDNPMEDPRLWLESVAGKAALQWVKAKNDDALNLLGDPAKSLECLEGSLALTAPGGVDEAEVQASLCLAYHAVQQPQRADEAWARAMEVYAVVTAGATQ